MAESRDHVLRVGGRSVPIADAERVVTDYLGGAGATYAYPYYDFFAGGPPDKITDGDLLTPTLLNAAPSIAGFAGLQGVRHRLEDALQGIPSHLDLVEAATDQIALLGPLYAILDHPGIADVRGTKLSKVLHRKRPMFIPLFDGNVRRCYQDGDAAPLPRLKGRSWADFMVALAGHMKDDLLLGLDEWDRLRCLGEHGPVSRLRVLDIVAWHEGRSPEAARGDAPGDDDEEGGRPNAEDE